MKSTEKIIDSGFKKQIHLKKAEFNRKIQVVHLIPNFVGGGTEYQLLQLLRNADRLRFNISVACLNAEGIYLPEVKKLGIDIFNLDIKPPSLLSFHNLKSILRFIKFLRQKSCDILSNWLYSANKIGALAGRAAMVPTIIYAKRGMGITEPRSYKRISWFLQYLLDAVIVNSDAIKKQCIQEGITHRKIYVIHNGIDVDRLFFDGSVDDLKAKLGIRKDQFIVGAVGNMYPVKGQQFLLDASVHVLKEIPNAFFLLIGDGDQRSELEDYTKKIGIGERVLFTGFRKDVHLLYNAMDLFVMPSLAEGLPSVILEAFAAGNPVVATNVGGIPEIVKDGDTGILVPPGDSQSLAAAIIRLAKNRRLASKLSENGREMVKMLTSEVMAEKTEKIYLQLISSKMRTNII